MSLRGCGLCALLLVVFTCMRGCRRGIHVSVRVGAVVGVYRLEAMFLYVFATCLLGIGAPGASGASGVAKQMF